MRLPLLLAVALLAVPADCGKSSSHLTLTSPGFANGESIPARFGCEDLNLSPPLRWSNVPDGAVELALVMADFGAPDGTFHHWIVVGIDPAVGRFEAGKVPVGARALANSADSIGYVGPCPPQGETHEYAFTLFPLGQTLALPDEPSVAEALGAIDRARMGGEGEFRGTFRR